MISLSSLLKEYRKKTGAKREDIASAAGISLAMYAKLESGKAKSTSNWRAIADFMGIPHEEFLASMPTISPAGGVAKSVKLIQRADGSFIGRVSGASDARTTTPDLSPVMATGDEPVDWAPTPPELQNVRGGYMIFAPDNAMEPRFFVGERISVHPGRPYTEGDFVVVALADGSRIARRYVRSDPRKGDIVVSQFNPPQETTMQKGDITSVHRILLPGL
ncbi:LexA family transcriptional regulator [Bosea sp. NPDC055332]